MRARRPYLFSRLRQQQPQPLIAIRTCPKRNFLIKKTIVAYL
jgi:hypothetical protein